MIFMIFAPKSWDKLDFESEVALGWPKIALTNRTVWGHFLGTCHFWGTTMLFFSKKQLKMYSFLIKKVYLNQNPQKMFWCNFGHFSPKNAFKKRENSPKNNFSKKILKGHIKKISLTKFRYWLSLLIFNVYMMPEVLLNELCKRIHNLDFWYLRPI